MPGSKLKSSLRKRLASGVMLSVLLAALLATTLTEPTTPVRAADDFPSFTYQGVAIEPANQTYNPTGEFIFPSLIKASDYFTSPLGTYYLYYAPHDAPGGISFSYANSLDGPWTEYAANPVIKNQWSPYYTVSHVSSPHAIWNAAAGKLFLYFHGDNSATRLASSSDGINFTYEQVAVGVSQFSNITEAAYARVFKYTIPSKNNTYTMLLMGNNNGTRKIYLAWSQDGKNWTTQPTPFLAPASDEGGQISAPFYFPYNGKHYLLYHDATGKIKATEIGANFDLARPAGVFYDIAGIRDASPFPYTVGNVMYLFYEQGPRLDAKIAWAKATLASTPQIYEAESLATTVSSGDSEVDFADANLSNGSGNKLNANAVGDWVSYTVNVATAGTYNVKIRVKKQNTRAIFQLSIAGSNQGTATDCYAASDTYAEIDLGSRTFSAAGNYSFKFSVTGKNASSIGYSLGNDYIKLTRQ